MEPPRLLRRSWPLLAALALLAVGLTAVIWACTARTGGTFVYPLDEPYIHMDMARNLAGSGTWGVTREGFSASSSSPGWTALLAGLYALFGPGELWPLVLNALLAIALCAAFHFHLERVGIRGPAAALLQAAAIGLTPVLVLVLCGQEHTLHALLSALFVCSAAGWLAEPGSARRLALLAALGAGLVLARYEGMFGVFAVVVLMLLRRRPLGALLLGAAAAAPVVAFGLWSLANGWSFFPNSILLKGNLPELGSWGGFFRFATTWAVQIAQNPHVLCLMLAAGFVLVLRARDLLRWERQSLELALFLGCALLHMQFSRAGWLFRYEAYLVLLGIWILPGSVRTVVRTGAGRGLRLALVALVAAAAIFLTVRGVASHPLLPAGSQGVYELQIQLGRFLDSRYSGQAVALTDIGACNYLADLRCLDLYGLSDRDVGRLRLAGRYDSRAMAELGRKRNVRIAAVFDWFPLETYGGTPPGWSKVASWKASRGSIDFYAVAREERRLLAEHLRAHAGELPPGVTQRLFPGPG
ncbi:MAG: hypothetical protein JXR96_16305 [Deltaproteobacteria bacterium]|nr:hypothetical protein [Deltaproteobacteria bacterium]